MNDLLEKKVFLMTGMGMYEQNKLGEEDCDHYIWTGCGAKNVHT